jgi:hypothetical protein
VKIPWPRPPAVDGSTRRVGRSRAAAHSCGLKTRHGGAGRAPPRSCSTAACPPIGGRARRREGPRRSSTDECGRLDLLDARVRLSRGAARRQRVHPSAGARVGETARGGAVTGRAVERGEMRSAAWREKAQMNPRVRARRRSRFCSAEIHAWPSDADGRLTSNGPCRSPDGTRLS